MRTALALATALFIAPQGVKAEWRAEIIPSGKVTAIETAAGTTLVAIGAQWFRLDMSAMPRLEPAPTPAKAKAPRGAIPNARVSAGANTIAAAWLKAPTKRYDHGVLGDDIEAEGVAVVYRDKREADFILPPDSVFEGLEPIVADIDGDGRDDVILTRSYLKTGSALAIVGDGNADGKLAIKYETPAVGHAHAWLNPAAVGDFDGDGKADIAIVVQPHVVGRLEIWSVRNGNLAKVAQGADFANHAIGSRVTAISAVADFDGDGVADIALPSRDRMAIRMVSFRGGAGRNIARVILPARAATNLALVQTASGAAVAVGLENGALVVVRNSPMALHKRSGAHR